MCVEHGLDTHSIAAFKTMRGQEGKKGIRKRENCRICLAGSK